MSTKEELKAWDYGEKGKNAAVYIEKKGELHTAMHDPKSEKFWNLYTKQNDPLSVATVYGSASIDSKAPTSGSIRSEVFDNEEERDSWITKTIKSKENKGYKEVDEAYTVEDAEAAKKSEG